MEQKKYFPYFSPLCHVRVHNLFCQWASLASVCSLMILCWLPGSHSRPSCLVSKHNSVRVNLAGTSVSVLLPNRLRPRFISCKFVSSMYRISFDAKHKLQCTNSCRHVYISIKMVHGVPDAILSSFLQERLAFDNTVLCVHWLLVLQPEIFLVEWTEVIHQASCIIDSVPFAGEVIISHSTHDVRDSTLTMIFTSLLMCSICYGFCSLITLPQP